MTALSRRSGGGDLVDEEVMEGLGVERVAGQDRDVLAEGHVAGRAPPPQASSSIAGRSSWISEYVWISSSAAGERQDAGRVDTQRGGRGQREHRPDPLAGSQQRIAHRLLESAEIRPPRGEKTICSR